MMDLKIFLMRMSGNHLIINRYKITNDNVLNKKVEFIKNKLKKIDVTFEF